MKLLAAIIVATALCLGTGAVSAYEVTGVSEFKTADKVGMEAVSVRIQSGDISGISGAVTEVFKRPDLKPSVSWAEAVVMACIATYDSVERCNEMSRRQQVGDIVRVVVPVAPRHEYNARIIGEATKPLEKEIGLLQQQVKQEREVVIAQRAEVSKLEAELKSDAPCEDHQKLTNVKVGEQVLMSWRCMADEMAKMNAGLQDNLASLQGKFSAVSEKLRIATQKVLDAGKLNMSLLNAKKETEWNLTMALIGAGILCFLLASGNTWQFVGNRRLKRANVQLRTENNYLLSCHPGFKFTYSYKNKKYGNHDVECVVKGPGVSEKTGLPTLKVIVNLPIKDKVVDKENLGDSIHKYFKNHNVVELRPDMVESEAAAA